MNTIRSGRMTLCAAAAAAALLTTGCANMSEREQGTAKGAGIGAVGGTVIGAVTGHTAAGAVVGGALGAVAGNLWSKRMEDRRHAVEQAAQGSNVEVTRTADNQLKINVPSDVSFDTGSAAIKPKLRSVLDSFASSLRDDPNARVNVIGHTDNTGSDALNQKLSLERARSVQNYLVDRGVPESRIHTAGRGEQEPVADNSTATGRAQNRRVEIYLSEQAATG